jgi:xylan 1,4-beta-xylosidase
MFARASILFCCVAIAVLSGCKSQVDGSHQPDDAPSDELAPGDTEGPDEAGDGETGDEAQEAEDSAPDEDAAAPADDGDGDEFPGDGDESNTDDDGAGDTDSELPPDEILAFDFSTNAGDATRRASGTLLGLSDDAPADNLIDALRPQLFRTAGFYNAAGNPYSRMHMRAPVVFAVGLKESYTCDGCGPCMTCPALPGENEDWAAWEGDVRAVIEAAAASGETYIWDVWNEPDLVPWSNEPWPDARFLETWRRAVLIIREEDPAAVISGPSVATFSAEPMKAFLNYAAGAGVLPDIVSWHEFGPWNGLVDAPQLIPQHAEEIRTYSGGFLTRFHINEWMDPYAHLRPGMAVWYFANLERAEVEAAARTCGWPEDGPENCFNDSLGGLLTDGTLQPRSIWWTHKAYADITGTLALAEPSTNFDGLAAFADGQIRALIGSHTAEQLSLKVSFTNVGVVTDASCVRVTVEEIPNTERNALVTPTLLLDEERAPSSGQLDLSLPAPPPWSAWVVTIAPCP